MFELQAHRRAYRAVTGAMPEMSILLLLQAGGNGR